MTDHYQHPDEIYHEETSEAMAAAPKVDNLVVFGQTNFRNTNRRFGIKVDDRRRHVYLIGKTGMGKSTVLENMIIQDINFGHGVCVIDPHGDLAEKILDYIPNHRIDDVIYFDPSDIDHPIAFNILEKVGDEYKHLVASGILGVFKKIWAESWGPRLEYVLRNAILALMDYPDSTLLGVIRILSDKDFRNEVIEKIKDPTVKGFWVNEYSKYPDKFQAEAIAPIQNKVGQFLSTSLVRNIVGQVQSHINLREIMDQRKILILNLSKGRVGEDSAALLGALIITKIQLAAMSRVDILEKDRQDFYLYVDEFQNFATESFANILSEARKYRLDLTLAHQYIEQLDEKVQAAVFGNVGTMIVFRVGAGDSEFLAKEFDPVFTETDLVNLAKFDIYLKLMIDGIASEPFSATTLPPLYEDWKTNNRERVIALSRQKYSTPREVVEKQIIEWWGLETGNSSKPKPFEPARSDRRPDRAPERKRDEKIEKRPELARQSSGDSNRRPETSRREDKREPTNDSIRQSEKKPIQQQPANSAKSKKQDEANQKLYPTNCWQCGTDMTLPFEPDGVRPTYCTNCFQQIRAGKVVASSTPPPSLAGAPVMIEEKAKPPAGISFMQAMGKNPFEPHETEIVEEDDEPRGITHNLTRNNAEIDREDDNSKPVFPPKPLPEKDLDFGDHDVTAKTIKPGDTIKF